MFPVSVVILTKGEEENIENALTSDADLWAEVMMPGLGMSHLHFEDQLKRLV